MLRRKVYFLNYRKLKSYCVNTRENNLIKVYLIRLKNEIFDGFSKFLNKVLFLKE